MTVKELIGLLEQVEDKTATILVPSEDHSYREASADVTVALVKGKNWTEDYGEKLTPAKEFGKRRPVVVIR